MEAEASSSDGSAIVKNEPASAVIPYEVNCMILCSHTDNLYYEAKIIAVEPQADDYMYTVHYQGWSKRYDENIPHSRTASRFRPFTVENIENAKIEMKEAKARAAELSNKKKSQKTEIRRRRPTSESSSKDNVLRDTSRDSSVESSPKKPRASEEMSVPQKLRTLLENDHHMVENELKLPILPGRSNVSKILEEYVSHVRKLDAVCSEVKMQKGRTRYWKCVVAALDESVESMKNFFDLVIVPDVLYPNEKLRHNDLKEGPKPVVSALTLAELLDESDDIRRPSDVYGFIYLLRLLVRFPEIIKQLPCDNDTTEILTVFTQSFIRYLGNSSEKYFDPEKDYEPVTRDYKQRLEQSNNI